MHPLSAGDRRRALSAPGGGIEAREAGLSKSVSVRQMAMIAIGSSIGTGLFLGSGIAVAYAGPGVLLSYVIAAFVAVVIMTSLAELTVVHASAGSFGAQAEYYIGGLAGYVTRYVYWTVQVLAIGGEATAIGLYMRLWYPNIPSAAWVAAAAVALFLLNLTSVKNFAWAEYAFTSIKVTAIILFILLGVYVIVGSRHGGAILRNLYAHGGFLPHGMFGVWMAVQMAIFSFYGIEVVAIAAGETKEPSASIPRAFRMQFVRLSIFYFGALFVMLSITPWNVTGSVDVSQSPFILSLQSLHIPFITGVLNFVIIMAAISSMNSDLYVCSRMLFSLARSGLAHPMFGKVTARNNVPSYAVIASSAGMIVALALNLFTPSAFNIIFGVSIFGGIFVWIMILLTFLAYMRHDDYHGRVSFRAPLAPLTQIAAILVMTGVLVTMGFSREWRFEWFVGAPFIGVIAFMYGIHRLRRSRSVDSR